MKTIAIFFAAGALALAAAGCTKQTTETPSAAAPASEAQPGTETTMEGARLAMVTPEAPPCVKAPPPDAVCTMDFNTCGHASMCDCGAGYVYDRAMGMCTLALEGVGQATPAPVTDDDCVKPATSVCTRDINACGQPSQCQCEEGYGWNAIAGKCIRDLG